MSRRRLGTEAGERGLALVSVLWGLTILSLVASAVIYSALLSAQMTRNDAARDQAAAVADAGVSRAILSLLDTRPNAHWPVDGAPQTFDFGGTKVQVSLQDEAGKIDINKAGPDILASLMESVGVTSSDALAIADRIAAWRTPHDVQDFGTGTRARGGDFQSVDEVQLVEGITPTLFARIAPALTVYSHQSAVDTGTAPRQVLLALPGMDGRKADLLLEARKAAAAPATPPPGHAFAIQARVRAAGIDFMRREVVVPTGDPVRPWLVYDWR